MDTLNVQAEGHPNPYLESVSDVIVPFSSVVLLTYLQKNTMMTGNRCERGVIMGDLN